MKKFRCAFALLVMFFSISNIANAQDNTAFSIVPIYPDNQVSTTKGYYDLKVNSGERQTLKVRITNNKNEELFIDITSANAYTDPNGGISYSLNIISPDKYLLNDNIQMANYISAPSNIIVKPNSTLEVPIVITTPNIRSGTLLGGIIFTIKDKVAQSQPIPGKDKANFEISTATAYVFGIQINLPTVEIPRLSFGNAGFLPEKLAAYIDLW